MSQVKIDDCGYRTDDGPFSLAASVHRDVQGMLNRMGWQRPQFFARDLAQARRRGFWTGLLLGVASATAGALGAVTGGPYAEPVLATVRAWLASVGIGG